MRRFYHLGLLALSAVLLATSCETTGQKRVAAAPPWRAQAPAIPTPAAPQVPAIPTPAAPQSPAPVSPASVAKPPAKPDVVENIIAAVETQYQEGLANYGAGHLEAAKDSFNRAFDMLLQAPVDIHSDDRLQDEFDKIVEGVNHLELLALKQGDGFSEPQLQPAPIDEANEVTFPVNPGVTAKAEAELKTTQSDLPLTMNDAVAAYINYFSTRGRGGLERGYVRAGRYRQMILKTLKAEGVPQDLIYLAQAESGFQPLALSRAGARGMWQFMAERGSQYGLARNWWVDERQDPVQATRAAAHHLKDLYDQFGDWYLAMAAYNSGPGTVQRAVERTGFADYWELYRRGVLPAETRNYVPIILAIAIISKNPAQYGLDRLRPDSPLPAEAVTINYPLDLRLAAECVDTSVAVLQELNPSLLRLTTPKDQPFELHLPAGTRDRFEKAIAAIPIDMRVWWHYHRVAHGETLAVIAREYHTTVRAIQDVNNLEGEELRPESKLIIPITPGRHDSDNVVYSPRAVRYRVRKGETVISLADRFGVSPQNLRQWNRLQGNSLAAGRVLTIHRPVPAAHETAANASSHASDRAGHSHTHMAKSKSGKILASRSRYKTNSAGATKTAQSSRARARTSVVAANGRAASARAKAASGRKHMALVSERRVVHKVKKGETLSSIASDYNVSVSDLRKNNRATTGLRAGTVLVIRSGE